MIRSQRGTKKGNMSLSAVSRVGAGGHGKNPHSVLLSNKHLQKLPPNMQIPEYKKNEYIRRDFSPYIKRFLQNQQNKSPKGHRSIRNEQHSLDRQSQNYPSQMQSNNSVIQTNERKRVWMPSGNPQGSKHTKKFVGYSIKRYYLN